MKKIDAQILSSTKTFITNFMCDSSMSKKTFSQLLNIFDHCIERQQYGDPGANDLKSICYYQDMKDKKWMQPIPLRIVNGEVQDGIHRGIAYLKCIQDGISEAELPDIYFCE